MMASPCTSAKVRFWSANFFTMRPVLTNSEASQRFDIVPGTFESALYLDLMRMLERGGVALRCSGCGLPIPYDHSGRANKQRARSKKGQPIYHSECFAEHARSRKKAYWQRRAVPEIPRAAAYAGARVPQIVLR